MANSPLFLFFESIKNKIRFKKLLSGVLIIAIILGLLAGFSEHIFLGTKHEKAVKENKIIIVGECSKRNYSFLQVIPLAVNEGYPLLLSFTNNATKYFLEDYMGVKSCDELILLSENVNDIDFIYKLNPERIVNISDPFLIQPYNSYSRAVIGVIGEKIDEIDRYTLTIFNFNKNEMYLPIDIPKNITSLKLTLKWNNADENLDLYVENPWGCVLERGESTIGNSEEVIVPTPVSGTWKVRIIAKINIGGIDFNLTIQTMKLTEEGYKTLFTLANAPVVASKLKAKLLFANKESLSGVIEKVKEKDVTVIDFFGLTNNIKAHILPNFYDVINFISSESGAVIADLSFDSLFPSSLVASHYQMPVLFPQVNCKEGIRASEEIWGYLSDLQCNYEPVEWFSYLMKNTSELVTNYLKKFGVKFNSKLLIISQRNTIKMTVDRALAGKFVVGRFPGKKIAIPLINRGIFYNVVRYANPNWNKLLASFVAYNHGIKYNESGIWESEDVRNVFEWLSSNVKFEVTKQGILDSLRNGTGFWYHCDHGEVNGITLGGEGRIGVFDKNVWRAYEPEGSVDNPDTINKYGNRKPDGLVMPFEENWIEGKELQTVGNLHSTIAIFMDCTIASTQIPMILLEHGAVNVIASFTTVHFSAGGYFTTFFTKRLCNGSSTGDAFVNTLTESAPIYYDYSGYANGSSLNFILFGDPSIKLREQELNIAVKYPNPVVKQLGGKLEIYVEDKNREKVKDVSVYVNNFSVSYNDGFGCYVYNVNDLDTGIHNLVIKVCKDMCGKSEAEITVKVVDFWVWYKWMVIGVAILLGIVIFEIALYIKRRKK